MYHISLYSQCSIARIYKSIGENILEFKEGEKNSTDTGQVKAAGIYPSN